MFFLNKYFFIESSRDTCMLFLCLLKDQRVACCKIHKTTSNEFQSFISKWEHGSQIFFKQAFPHIDIFLRTVNQRTPYKNTQQVFLNFHFTTCGFFFLETINNQNSLLIIHYYMWCSYFLLFDTKHGNLNDNINIYILYACCTYVFVTL